MMADNNITGASLKPIYTQLNSTPTYHPLEADTFADWSMEAGDIITISRDGKDYKSPVHNSTISWSKGQQVKVSSTGNEKREPIAKASQKQYSGGHGGGGALRNHRYEHIYVEDQYNQMVSGLILTGSAARLYVDDKYNQMSAGLDLTSSSAHLYVDNKYKQMQAGLSLTSSSAALYVQSKTSRAYIMARINANGESEDLIHADKVSITGRTTINDVMTVSDRSLYIKVPTRLSNNLMLSSLTMRGAGDDNTIGPEVFGKIIKSASVSNNVLTLTSIDGTQTTFSKATSLSGVWSGAGKLTVTASPQGETLERLLVAKSASGGKIPIYAQYGSSGQYEEDTGFRVNIPSGPTYTKYTFSKTRTSDSSGYHYTFSIGTGWQAPFGGDGGTYDLYDKD